MFTIEEITAVHSRVKTGADFPAYVQDMKTLGVHRYEHFVSDGHTTYYGNYGFVLEGPAKYTALPVKDEASKDALQHALAIHQQGETEFPTFCKHAAQAGVEKWEVHTVKLACTYLDKAGNVMLVEEIPVPEAIIN